MEDDEAYEDRSVTPNKARGGKKRADSIGSEKEAKPAKAVAPKLSASLKKTELKGMNQAKGVLTQQEMRRLNLRGGELHSWLVTLSD